MDTQIVNHGEEPVKTETLITNGGLTITKYSGFPLRGAKADSATAWAIKKDVTTISSDGNTIGTATTWVGGTSEKTWAWSQRATYTYSQV